MTRVYIASALPTDYPYKLQKPAHISQTVRETADDFILDSGIGDDVTNHEVLELAVKYEADWVIAKDYLHDQQATTESVHEFIELYESHRCDATPMIPLQPPHAEHYQELSGFGHYVLGGMAGEECSTTQQYQWIRDFRKQAPDVYAHGLGVGGSLNFVRKVARAGLLDSVDCSTPEHAARFGAVINDRLKHEELRIMKGEGARKRNVPLATFNSFQIQDAWDREKEVSGLEAFTQ